MPMNVTRADSIAAALRGHDDVDGLVHCAGGFRWAPLEELTDADLDFLLGLNLRSTLMLLRALLPGMKQRNFGRVVLVGAASAQRPGAGVSAYAASKAGVHAVAQAMAAEVRAFDITVNAVLPTTLDTPAARRDMPGADTSDWVTPSQLARLILSLVRDDNAVSGALVPATGR